MATIVALPVLVSQCNIMYCRTQVAGPKTGEIRGLNQDNRPSAPKSVIAGRLEAT